MIELQIGVGQVGPVPDDAMPGAIIGVHKIGITPSIRPGPTTVDAAVCNPERTRRPTKKAK
jgi:hypothetical protein